MHALSANTACTITASSNERPMAAKSPIAASSPSRLQTPGECLSSWKEIASYLKRTVRTVQRWERHEGLPIHRHKHRRANSVYAHRSELDNWWSREVPSSDARQICGRSERSVREVTHSRPLSRIHLGESLQGTDPIPLKWSVECVLELRIKGLFSPCTATGCPVRMLRLRIPVPGHLLGLESRTTTRNAKVSRRSLSLAAC